MADNLVIIGNGFDLAHGKRTSYPSFIRRLVENQLYAQELFNSKGIRTYSAFMKAIDPTIYQKNDTKPVFENKFLQRLLMKISAEKWCDIEHLYFEELLNIDLAKKDLNPYDNSVLKLNEDFNVIKNCLESYLKEEEGQENKPIKAYTEFFDLIA